MQNHIANIGKIIEDVEIYLRMKMDQLLMQKFSNTITTLKHPKQLQLKIATPISEFGNKNIGVRDMKTISKISNVSATISARASSMNKINNDDDDDSNNNTTSFSFGVAAATLAQSSSSATAGDVVSNIKNNFG